MFVLFIICVIKYRLYVWVIFSSIFIIVGCIIVCFCIFLGLFFFRIIFSSWYVIFLFLFSCWCIIWVMFSLFVLFILFFVGFFCWVVCVMDVVIVVDKVFGLEFMEVFVGVCVVDVDVVFVLFFLFMWGCGWVFGIC